MISGDCFTRFLWTLAGRDTGERFSLSRRRCTQRSDRTTSARRVVDRRTKEYVRIRMITDKKDWGRSERKATRRIFFHLRRHRRSFSRSKTRGRRRWKSFNCHQYLSSSRRRRQRVSLSEVATAETATEAQTTGGQEEVIAWITMQWRLWTHVRFANVFCVHAAFLPSAEPYGQQTLFGIKNIFGGRGSSTILQYWA